ncbi:MAG: hypothetical protein H7222_00845 [Methylotenera sp.]|nr:hypothetical protein [Oligoflexia bacterium]
MKIGIVTCEKMPHLNPRENSLVECLRAEKFEVVPYVWSRPEHERKKYDVILIRSPWDYFERLEEFSAWLERLPARRVFNPREILKWNLDKVYLRELESRGVRIVPTKWIRSATSQDLRQAIAFSGLNELVLKPTRSAAAFKTVRFKKTELPEFGQFEGLSMMLQPMAREILSEGEWSLIYFGGRFSHALLKRPASGDFRVQYLHGGTESRVVAPDAALLDFGSQVIEAVGTKLLYARVDFVRLEGVPHLMELEVLEPDLFFHLDPEAPRRFVNVLNQFLAP